MSICRRIDPTSGRHKPPMPTTERLTVLFLVPALLRWFVAWSWLSGGKCIPDLACISSTGTHASAT